MTRLLLSPSIASVGLVLAVTFLARAAEHPPSTAKVTKMKGFVLGMEPKAAEAVLVQHGVKYKAKGRDKPVPGRSLVIRGNYAFGGGEVVLYFVDGTLWEIKLRGSEGLCEQHTSDLGPPVRQKDGCKFWFDEKKLFAAFYRPASPSRSEGAECQVVSFEPLRRAGLSRELLEREFEALKPPVP